MSGKIVLIEDSERYISELVGLLGDRLKVPQEEIEVIHTEAEFYSALTRWRSDPPAAFVVDIMIPFTSVGDPADHVPVQVREKAKTDRFYRAGIRCVNALLQIAALKNTPMIIHSILERADLESDPRYPLPGPPNVTICPKESNTHGIIDALLRIPGLSKQPEYI